MRCVAIEGQVFPSSIISPMLTDSSKQERRIVFDFFGASEEAELHVVIKEIEFHAHADKREGNHDRIVAQMIESVMNPFSIEIIQEGDDIPYSLKLHFELTSYIHLGREF